MRFRRHLLLVLLLAWSVPAVAANPDAQNYRRAFALIDSGHALEAGIFASRGRDPVLNKVIRAIYMAQPGNDASFAEMQDFILRNPDWPDLRGIQAIAEQKMPSAQPAQVVAWFEAHPPVSTAGFYRYVDALNLAGKAENVPALIRSRWIEGEFSGDEQVAFHDRFSSVLEDADMLARLDRLLWKNDANAARRMYQYVSLGQKELAEARLGLAAKAPNADALVARVPRDLVDDPGLLYERLRWHVRNNQDDEALTILRHAPQDNPGKPEGWWEQRQIMVRRLLGKGDYEDAYELADHHGNLGGKQLVDAEFLCGWLALRFLDSQEDARRHFQALYNAAGTPISRARGAYWLGRTYEAHGDKANAEQFYETAAALNITYYGQLAAARIYENPMVNAAPEPAIPASVRTAFYDRDLIRAIEHLDALGERDRTHAFFHAAVESAQQRADFALLTELAYRIDRPDYAVEAGKAANQKNMLMAAGGFPLLSRNVPHPPDPAFLHALIRQESMFNPEAQSPVGAMGLTQMMPATAKGVAKKLGMRFKPQMLANPDVNLRLGAAFVENQISNFNGSYVLALAGYNAGPHRVREWMEQIGDPRQDDVDVIDWVEKIPVSETRNYVQRIMESLQVYRARLAGGQAPLQILKDLKR